jgi:integrase
MRRYFNELEDLDPHTITRRTLTPWFQAIGVKSHNTANAMLGELKLIYATMLQFDWFEGNIPTASMKRFARNKPRKRFIQYDELEAVMNSIALEPKPFQLIFLLSLIVGCRPGEAVAMQWRDVKFWQEPDARTGQLIWRGRWKKLHTKTKVKHEVPIPAELVTRFRELDRTSEWIFSGDQTHCRRAKAGPVSYASVWKAWVRIRQRIGMDDLWGYDLRRSCATILANRGTNLGIISKGVLAHTNLQHTGTYVCEMPESVEMALQDHSKFVLGGGRAEVKAPGVATAPVRSIVDHSRDSREEWPG